AVLGASAGAQGQGWRLPDRGAAEFERTTLEYRVTTPEHDRERGLRRLIARAAEGGHGWRYRTAGRAGTDGFERPDFDASGFREGRTPFGDRPPAGAWPAQQRFLEARTSVQLPRRPLRAAVLTIHHDDVATVWVNGIQVYHSGFVGHPVHHALSAEQVAAFVPGDNVVAVRVENTGGASFFDLGLTVGDRAYRDPEAALQVVRDAIEAADRMRDGLFPAWRAPAWLCQGQLAPDRRSIALPPVDLRDL